MFSVTVITGISMKCWCTMPIPSSIASFGECSVAGGREANLALVRRVEAVEDVHQGRLARPVLAEQRVHLAGQEVEVDAVVRDDSRERFVMPRSSRTGTSVIAARFYAETKGGPCGPPFSPRAKPSLTVFGGLILLLMICFLSAGSACSTPAAHAPAG